MATAHTAVPEPAGAAAEIVSRCRELAALTTEPGWTTRPFLSEPMHQVHAKLRRWLSRAGLEVSVDGAGNLRGVRAGTSPRRLYIGSHLDTVPRAGAFDGVLGVVAAVSLMERLQGRVLPFTIEIVGFSDEEGVRFGVPFIGSRAFVGDVDEALLETSDQAGVSVAEALVQFGIKKPIAAARAEHGAIGWLELHIEQGPVLERLGLPLGIVDSIAGQTRLEVTFTGGANHAGTTPMDARRDALTGMAEWILAVEGAAKAIPDLVATVGRLQVEPGATNVIPGECRASLDLRHAMDEVREAARDHLLAAVATIAARRDLGINSETWLNQPAVPMHEGLISRLAAAVDRAGYPVYRMASGAGHDAMVVARAMPAAMLFVRSPGGISHHPDEAVVDSDLAAALTVLEKVIDDLASTHD